VHLLWGGKTEYDEEHHQENAKYDPWDKSPPLISQHMNDTASEIYQKAKVSFYLATAPCNLC
jgi:hypothetical protein